MRPMKLVMSGWGPFRERTTIDFSEFERGGLFLITGQTGAGKTTIFDAITYALYGTLSGALREKGSVRSDFADETTPTYVELAMCHGGKAYTVTRNPEYLRPKKRKTGKTEGEKVAYTKEKENALLREPDGSVVEGSSAVNQRLRDILVLDERQFKQISMIAQGEFAKMLSAGGAEKTRIFREIFGTGIYSRVAEQLKEQAETLYRQVVAYRQRMEENVRMFSCGEESWELLVGEGNYPYGAIVDWLQEKRGVWQQEETLLRQKGEQLEEALLDKNRAYSEAKNHKEQLRQLDEANRQLVECKQRAPQMDLLRTEKERAEAAEAIRTEREQVRSAEKLLEQTKIQLQQQTRELVALEAEQSTLAILQSQKDAIYAGFALEETLLDKELQWERQKKLVEEREKTYTAMQEAFVRQDEETRIKREHYEEADSCYRRAAVGIVARLIKAGEPCPVCGSMEHPRVAAVSEEIPSEEELKEWQTQYEEARQKREEYFAAAREAKSLVEEGQRAKQELQTELEELKRQKMELTDSVKERMQKPLADSKKKFEAQLERFTSLTAMGEEKARQIEQTKRLLTDKETEVEKLTADWLMTLQEHGFDTEAVYEDCLRDRKNIQDMEQTLLAYLQKKQSVEALVAHLTTETLGKCDIDLTVFEGEMQTLREQRGEVEQERQQRAMLVKDAGQVLHALQENQKKILPLEAQYGALGELERVANGKNSRRLVFEQYVLAGYFEEILRAANLRLLRMSEGRFALKRAAESRDGRVKDGMEMLVLDHYTGKSRSVRTLSGGESFLASLALALGMSDVVQAESGGIQVEALFIDEGFGALDAESLEQACDVLNSLGGKDKMVGIISHVPELGERIEQQIVIEKTNHGSYVRMPGHGGKTNR